MYNFSRKDMDGFGMIINADGDGTYSNVLPPDYLLCGMSLVQYVKIMIKDSKGKGSALLSVVVGELVPMVRVHLADHPLNWVLIVCHHGRNRYPLHFLFCARCVCV
jgi:hypothetical protein